MEENTSILPSTYKTLDQEIGETLQKIENGSKDLATFYIHAAKLYSCQGQQYKAIYILNEGINTVADDDNEARHTLQQQIEIVTQQSKRRIDFISQTPYEIIATILEHLVDNQKASIVCLDVCRAWRSKFIEHAATAWSSFDIHGSPSKRKLLKALPVISKYIKNLLVYPSIRLESNLSELLKTHDFSNLQALSIKYSKGGAYAIDFDRKKYVMDALAIIGKQLTGLDICVRQATEISLQQVLSLCPRLRAFKLDVNSNMIDCLLPVSGAFPTSLTRIEIISHCKVINLSIIEPLFNYTPHLRHLILYKFYSQTNLLAVLGDRCPKLVEIRMTEYEPESMLEIQHSKSRPLITPKSIETDGQEGGGEGLQCLELHTYNIPSAISFADRLKKSCHSLKKISLTPITIFARNAATPMDWEPLYSLTMYNLSVFSVSSVSRSFYDHLPSILLRFPALESLYLNFPVRSRELSYHNNSLANDGTTQDNIFNAIAELKKLSKLHLTHVYVGDPGFKRYLSRMIMQGDPNNINRQTNYGLRNLKLYRCEGLNISLMNDIAMIHSLQSLTLFDFFDSWLEQTPVAVDDIVIMEFQEALTTVLTTLPKLSKLDLNMIPLMLSTVKSMMDCESLNNLKLGRAVNYYKCTKGEVRKLVNRKFKGTSKIR
ncbi:hypothetical protein BDA99DRAFT_498525 [Phascolomyces articulosus]|uniref:F-box domain-containing protein n=1 Tax=Phascolomyces articulosus TaxID=60185 RepID=A0AAD5PHX1_9FUNG|nr:hypothetical protein BDA99DRAFT_498525 [Phascolomyces articulosus]